MHGQKATEGVPGSKSWMAARLGAAGGRVRGDAKAEASRDNGKRGGRPRKVTAGSRSDPRSSSTENCNESTAPVSLCRLLIGPSPAS
jgi:hypothetical protein